jgi:hypothetical protein
MAALFEAAGENLLAGAGQACTSFALGNAIAGCKHHADGQLVRAFLDPAQVHAVFSAGNCNEVCTMTCPAYLSCLRL